MRRFQITQSSPDAPLWPYSSGCRSPLSAHLSVPDLPWAPGASEAIFEWEASVRLTYTSTHTPHTGRPVADPSPSAQRGVRSHYCMFEMWTFCVRIWWGQMSYELKFHSSFKCVLFPTTHYSIFTRSRFSTDTELKDSGFRAKIST